MSVLSAPAKCPVRHGGSTVPPRFQQGPITTAMNLGPLALLAGSWKGSGFNAIWRPDNDAAEAGQPAFVKRFLELNKTSETLDFHVIPAVVPNRGLEPQPDISLYGLHYLQRVTDDDPEPFSTAGQALHIEPGLFMNVPSTVDPVASSTIVRMASIPHGVTVLMQGQNNGTAPIAGPPVIPHVYPIAGLPKVTPAAGALGLGILPIDVPAPPAPTSTVHTAAVEQDLAINVAGSQSNGPFNLPGQDHFQEYVNDPNHLLRHTIAHQDILGHLVIDLNTDNGKGGVGIDQIPFLGSTSPTQDAMPAKDIANAFVYSARSTFWIEWVRVPGGPPPIEKLKFVNPEVYSIEPFYPEHTYLQLQYSQVVILIFNGVFWPHVTVATLRLSAG